MAKYKYYFISPFDEIHYATRTDAERFYKGITDGATLCAMCHNGSVKELKSKNGIGIKCACFNIITIYKSGRRKNETFDFGINVTLRDIRNFYKKHHNLSLVETIYISDINDIVTMVWQDTKSF